MKPIGNNRTETPSPARGSTMRQFGIHRIAALCCLWACLLLPAGLLASPPFKVMVVMSYDDQYAWSREIKEGIDGVLSESCVLEYVWLNTKVDLAGGPAKARRAWEVYGEFQPHGVIAADDNAQSMFVVPYLKGKVKTPVMFCGVNGELKDFGYPAQNVSGILERAHIRNSISFAQMLVPSIRRVIYLSRKSPSAAAVFRQYQREHHTYPVESVAFIMPRTLDEALERIRELREESDALFYETMESIRDGNNRRYSDTEVVPLVAEAFGKPMISNNLAHVEAGTLCAVVKTGQEQGATAAEMLLTAMEGTPVPRIGVTQNRQGKRIINLRVIKEMGIKPGSDALKGVQIVGIER